MAILLRGAGPRSGPDSFDALDRAFLAGHARKLRTVPRYVDSGAVIGTQRCRCMSRLSTSLAVSVAVVATWFVGAETPGLVQTQASVTRKNTVRRVTVFFRANEVLTIKLHPDQHFISVNSTETLRVCPGSMSGGIGTKQDTSWGQLWIRCFPPATKARTIDIPYLNRHLAIAFLSNRSGRVSISYVPKDDFLMCMSSKSYVLCVP
jgi:hypothetical protein